MESQKKPKSFSDQFELPHETLLVMKTLKDQWYIGCHKGLQMYEILIDFFVVLSYIACLHYPYIRIETTVSMVLHYIKTAYSKTQ